MTITEQKRIERSIWLSEVSRQEKDVLFDENSQREYILMEWENEHGENGYISMTKIFLPEDLQK